MIVLDFRADDRVIEEDKEADPAQADPAALQETYLMMPVRLSVNGREMLSVQNQPQSRVFAGGLGIQPQIEEAAPTENPWLKLPLLHVATLGLAAAEAAKSTGTASYSLPGSGSLLHFMVDGDRITVQSDLNGHAEHVPTAELIEAFRAFGTRVRELVSKELPELLIHPVWGAWLTSSG